MAPKDDLIATQTFQCKSCGIDVTYKRKTVLGLTIRGDDNGNGDKQKVVYLTCAEGHTHPYTVIGA